MSSPHTRDLFGTRARRFNTQRHQSQSIGTNARAHAVVHRCLTATQHHVRALANLLKAVAEHAHTVACELLRVVQKGEIVQGHDQLRVGRAGNQRGGVGDVDRSGRNFDLRPLHAQPRLIQPWRGDRQLCDRDLRNPWFWRQSTVAASDAHQTNVVVRAQGLGNSQRSHASAAGNPMPALFKGVRDSHTTHHALPRRSLTHMRGL